MLSAVIVFGILSFIVFLVKTEKISEKKRKYIIHSIGIILLLFGLIVSMEDFDKNYSEKSVWVTIFIILFFPIGYYILIWSFSKNKNTMICKHCQSLIEIEVQELKNKKCICLNCHEENDIIDEHNN